MSSSFLNLTSLVSGLVGNKSGGKHQHQQLHSNVLSIFDTLDQIQREVTLLRSQRQAAIAQHSSSLSSSTTASSAHTTSKKSGVGTWTKLPSVLLSQITSCLGDADMLLPSTICRDWYQIFEIGFNNTISMGWSRVRARVIAASNIRRGRFALRIQHQPQRTSFYEWSHPHQNELHDTDDIRVCMRSDGRFVCVNRVSLHMNIIDARYLDVFAMQTPYKPLPTHHPYVVRYQQYLKSYELHSAPQPLINFVSPIYYIPQHPHETKTTATTITDDEWHQAMLASGQSLPSAVYPLPTKTEFEQYYVDNNARYTTQLVTPLPSLKMSAEEWLARLSVLGEQNEGMDQFRTTLLNDDIIVITVPAWTSVWQLSTGRCLTQFPMLYSRHHRLRPNNGRGAVNPVTRTDESIDRRRYWLWKYGAQATNIWDLRTGGVLTPSVLHWPLPTAQQQWLNDSDVLKGRAKPSLISHIDCMYHWHQYDIMIVITSRCICIYDLCNVVEPNDLVHLQPYILAVISDCCTDRVQASISTCDTRVAVSWASGTHEVCVWDLTTFFTTRHQQLVNSIRNVTKHINEHDDISIINSPPSFMFDTPPPLSSSSSHTSPMGDVWSSIPPPIGAMLNGVGSDARHEIQLRVHSTLSGLFPLQPIGAFLSPSHQIICLTPHALFLYDIGSKLHCMDIHTGVRYWSMDKRWDDQGWRPTLDCTRRMVYDEHHHRLFITARYSISILEFGDIRSLAALRPLPITRNAAKIAVESGHVSLIRHWIQSGIMLHASLHHNILRGMILDACEWREDQASYGSQYDREMTSLHCARVLEPRNDELPSKQDAKKLRHMNENKKLLSSPPYIEPFSRYTNVGEEESLRLIRQFINPNTTVQDVVGAAARDTEPTWWKKKDDEKIINNDNSNENTCEDGWIITRTEESPHRQPYNRYQPKLWQMAYSNINDTWFEQAEDDMMWYILSPQLIIIEIIARAITSSTRPPPITPATVTPATSGWTHLLNILDTSPTYLLSHCRTNVQIACRLLDHHADPYFIFRRRSSDANDDNMLNFSAIHRAAAKGRVTLLTHLLSRCSSLPTTSSAHNSHNAVNYGNGQSKRWLANPPTPAYDPSESRAGVEHWPNWNDSDCIPKSLMNYRSWHHQHNINLGSWTCRRQFTHIANQFGVPFNYGVPLTTATSSSLSTSSNGSNDGKWSILDKYDMCNGWIHNEEVFSSDVHSGRGNTINWRYGCQLEGVPAEPNSRHGYLETHTAPPPFPRNYTPLHMVALCRRPRAAIRTARLLIKYGGNVNAMTTTDVWWSGAADTPLSMAARYGRIALVRLLCQFEHQSIATRYNLVPRSSRNSNNDGPASSLLVLNPLFEAIRLSRWHVIEYFVQTGQYLFGYIGESVLHQCVLWGNTYAGMLCVAYYPELLTHVDNDGRAPLHYTAYAHGFYTNSYREIAQWLINKHGCDPFPRTDDGDTPLILSLRNSVEEIWNRMSTYEAINRATLFEQLAVKNKFNRGVLDYIIDPEMYHRLSSVADGEKGVENILYTYRAMRIQRYHAHIDIATNIIIDSINHCTATMHHPTASAAANMSDVELKCSKTRGSITSQLISMMDGIAIEELHYLPTGDSTQIQSIIDRGFDDTYIHLRLAEDGNARPSTFAHMADRIAMMHEVWQYQDKWNRTATRPYRPEYSAQRITERILRLVQANLQQRQDQYLAAIAAANARGDTVKPIQPPLPLPDDQNMQRMDTILALAQKHLANLKSSSVAVAVATAPQGTTKSDHKVETKYVPLWKQQLNDVRSNLPQQHSVYDHDSKDEQLLDGEGGGRYQLQMIAHLTENTPEAIAPIVAHALRYQSVSHQPTLIWKRDALSEARHKKKRDGQAMKATKRREWDDRRLVGNFESPLQPDAIQQAKEFIQSVSLSSTTKLSVKQASIASSSRVSYHRERTSATLSIAVSRLLRRCIQTILSPWILTHIRLHTHTCDEYQWNRRQPYNGVKDGDYPAELPGNENWQLSPPWMTLPFVWQDHDHVMAEMNPTVQPTPPVQTSVNNDWTKDVRMEYPSTQRTIYQQQFDSIMTQISKGHYYQPSKPPLHDNVELKEDKASISSSPSSHDDVHSFPHSARVIPSRRGRDWHDMNTLRGMRLPERARGWEFNWPHYRQVSTSLPLHWKNRWPLPNDAKQGRQTLSGHTRPPLKQWSDECLAMACALVPILSKIIIRLFRESLNETTQVGEDRSRNSHNSDDIADATTLTHLKLISYYESLALIAILRRQISTIRGITTR